MLITSNFIRIGMHVETIHTDESYFSPTTNNEWEEEEGDVSAVAAQRIWSEVMFPTFNLARSPPLINYAICVTKRN